MAFPQTGTKLANLINPQVLSDYIDQKLIDYIRFAPLADIDTTLVNAPGSILTLPKYAYIGDAAVVAEAGDIPIKQLSATSTPVPVYKIGNGVQITDEAVLSGYGDPVGEAVSQILKSIASAFESKFIANLEGNTNYYAAAGSQINTTDVAKSLALFGEDIDGAKVLLVDPATYNTFISGVTGWIPASQMAAEAVIKGVVGEVYGCQVVVTNRIKNGHAYIVKPGALKLIMKRDTLVETDRDIINKSTVITADKHACTYLANDSKVITIVKHGETIPPASADDDNADETPETPETPGQE